MTVMHTLIQLSVIANSAQIDLLSELFFALGAETVTCEDARNEPLFQLSPEDHPHWQHTMVRGLFDGAVDMNHVIFVIKNNQEEFSQLIFSVEKIENKNWVAETQKFFSAQQFGKLWICPQWDAKIFTQKPVVFIEPGLAFGTGTHPTTQLCLTWLATHDLADKTVVDYGCGSGILALGAMALGAKKVFATDHDDQALESTVNNVAYNNFDRDRLVIKKIGKMEGIKANIVIANILANTIIDLAAVLTNLVLPGGKLILSGILREDSERVFQVYQDNFTVVDTQCQGEWVLLELETR